MISKRIHDLYWRTFPYYMYRVYRAYKAGDAVPVPQKLKIRTILDYAGRFGIGTLIETGTYKGDTVAATQAAFQEIHSIELSPALAERARLRFAGINHVHIHQGDSGFLLKRILAEITQPCLFWLDAHYSAGITARGVEDSPIVAELDAIFSHPVSGHVILIDDAREFTGNHGYPMLEDLYEYVLKQKPNHRFVAYNDMIRIWPVNRGKSG